MCLQKNKLARKLVHLNREYHNHDMYVDSFNEAVQGVKEQVIDVLYNRTGIKCTVKVGSEWDTDLQCDVTTVYLVFDSDSDLAMYNLITEQYSLIARHFEKPADDKSAEFTHWI